MNQHAILNIVPAVNAFDGRLNAVTFTAVATDDAGQSASQAITEILSAKVMPSAKDFTNDELTAICQSIAMSRRVYSALDGQLAAARTPAYVPPPPAAPPTDAEVKAGLSQQVDNAARALYSRFTAFSQEYEPRESAARAYKAAGYTGEPTAWVTDFTNSAGISVQQGVDRIIAQADMLRGAVQMLAGLRMKKYLIDSAATLDDARAQCASIIDAISNLAASLA